MPKLLSPDHLEEFSKRIRVHMKKIGIHSEAELARRVSKAKGEDIGRQLVHKWTNAHSFPSNANLEALAEALGVAASELVIVEGAGGRVVNPAPLSTARVPFRVLPDPHNPALVRAEMSDLLTREQAEKIAALLGRV